MEALDRLTDLEHADVGAQGLGVGLGLRRGRGRRGWAAMPPPLSDAELNSCTRSSSSGMSMIGSGACGGMPGATKVPMPAGTTTTLPCAATAAAPLNTSTFVVRFASTLAE